MTDETHDHQDNCLMCTVRALTSGRPNNWFPANEGDRVTGVILRMGEEPSVFAPEQTSTVKVVDLWQGGRNRVRITAYGSMLTAALSRAEPEVGDTLTVIYDGEKTIESGRFAGRPYRAFRVEIQRGH
jgi:hypothetical protein